MIDGQSSSDLPADRHRLQEGTSQIRTEGTLPFEQVKLPDWVCNLLSSLVLALLRRRRHFR